MSSNQIFSLLFFGAIAIALFSGCGSVKYEELLMLEDVGNEQFPIDSFPVLEIRSDDILSIQVASRNPETVIAFQAQQRYQDFRGGAGEEGLGSAGQGYRVDEDGNIYLPFLGQIKAAGKSLSELREEITDGLSKYIPDASVQVRFLNFRVTVLGEVMRPNTYVISNERLTVLEAIGMAGDFTPYARRNNVLVIRQREDQREFARLDTQDRTLFESSYFYLSPNDIVYVEPLEAKRYATQGDFIQRYAGVMLPLVSLLTFVLSAAIFQN